MISVKVNDTCDPYDPEHPTGDCIYILLCFNVAEITYEHMGILSCWCADDFGKDICLNYRQSVNESLINLIWP